MGFLMLSRNTHEIVTEGQSEGLLACKCPRNRTCRLQLHCLWHELKSWIFPFFPFYISMYWIFSCKFHVRYQKCKLKLIIYLKFRSIFFTWITAACKKPTSLFFLLNTTKWIYCNQGFVYFFTLFSFFFFFFLFFIFYFLLSPLPPNIHVTVQHTFTIFTVLNHSNRGKSILTCHGEISLTPGYQNHPDFLTANLSHWKHIRCISAVHF